MPGNITDKLAFYEHLINGDLNAQMSVTQMVKIYRMHMHCQLPWCTLCSSQILLDSEALKSQREFTWWRSKWCDPVSGFRKGQHGPSLGIDNRHAQPKPSSDLVPLAIHMVDMFKEITVSSQTELNVPLSYTDYVPGPMALRFQKKHT